MKDRLEEIIQQYVFTIIAGFIDNPKALKVSVLVGVNNYIVEAQAHPDDVGRLIGKGGKTAEAIRTLLKNVGIKHEIRITFSPLVDK